MLHVIGVALLQDQVKIAIWSVARWRVARCSVVKQRVASWIVAGNALQTIRNLIRKVCVVSGRYS